MQEPETSKNEVFVSYRRRHGVPEGVGELDGDVWTRRRETYRFSSRDGRVRTVELINGLGYPTEKDDVCRWDLSWRDDGSLEAIAHSNRTGHTALREVFNRDATIVDFFHDDQSASARTGFSGGSDFGFEFTNSFVEKKTRIMRHLLDHDANGWCTRKRFCSDTFNTPAQDVVGAFGEA